jgi:hypothetical protein
VSRRGIGKFEGKRTLVVRCEVTEDAESYFLLRERWKRETEKKKKIVMKNGITSCWV